MIVLQLLLYCLLFTGMVKIFVIGGAVNGLYFYPKEVQERAIALGLTDRKTVERKRKWFMTTFCLVMLVALVLIIRVWNGISTFNAAYWQALLFRLFCKCWGKRKQRSCEINQMRTAL